MSKTLALRPRLSEKSYALSEKQNVYVFDVPAGTNRHAVAKAIADQFNVTVKSVRIAATPTKTKRTYRRGGRVVLRGKTSAIRKAYVHLKEDDKLPIFSAAEEDKKKSREAK